ncbi:hypothetical protein EV426DRAFT_541413 [Tirmania nivea]|nr:hypothetical protein EV426DRAFT_541413 [Tirmania nivea]
MTLPIGATLVPVLFASDATHLTNFSSNGKVWPLYMSIGNIKSSIRNQPTSHAWVPVALLPNAPKRVKRILSWSEDKQKQEGIQVIYDLLTFVLRPLSNTTRDGHNVKCCDEVIRRCYFRVASWLVDHMENSTIHGIYSTRCPICKSPQAKLGDLQRHPIRDAKQYMAWIGQSDTIRLHSARVKFVKNAL